jgi:hypothetical protein
MRRSIAAALAVLSLTLVMGACSKSKQLEDKMAQVIEDQLKAKNVKVDCPGDVKAKKGEEVTCTATGDFTAIPSDATKFNFHVRFEDDNSFLIDSASPADEASSSSSSSDTSLSDTSSSDSTSATLPGG